MRVLNYDYSTSIVYINSIARTDGERMRYIVLVLGPYFNSKKLLVTVRDPTAHCHPPPPPVSDKEIARAALNDPLIDHFLPKSLRCDEVYIEGGGFVKMRNGKLIFWSRSKQSSPARYTLHKVIKRALIGAGIKGVDYEIRDALENYDDVICRSVW